MLTQISVHKYHLRLFLHVSHICTSWRLHPCDHSCMLHALIMYRLREIHSLRIYICIYVWTINNRKDGNNTVRNYTLVGQSDAFGDPRTSSTPEKSCVKWMFTFCLDRTLLKTIYFGIRREEKKTNRSKACIIRCILHIFLL